MYFEESMIAFSHRLASTIFHRTPIRRSFRLISHSSVGVIAALGDESFFVNNRYGAPFVLLDGSLVTYDRTSNNLFPPFSSLDCEFLPTPRVALF